MSINLNEVKKDVELYFKEHLPQYTVVLEIRRKSNHPDDDYLYMVSAKKSDNTYAVWTWNESTKSLNHGHYNLKSVEDCEKIFEEHQDVKQYFEVYKYSQNSQFRLFITDSEGTAKNYCETHNWELKDENEFVWNLDYRHCSIYQ